MCFKASGSLDASEKLKKSNERSTSCLTSLSSYFFKTNSNKQALTSSVVKHHNEQAQLKYERFLAEYEDYQLEYEDDNFLDDQVTLHNLSDGNSKKDIKIETFDSTKRLKELRKIMIQYGIGVYIIPSEDEHLSEYTSPKDRKREYISGFTGSAGIAIVTVTSSSTSSTIEGEAALSTDGRYYLQAEQQLDDNWTLLKQTVPSVPSWQSWTIEKALKNSFSKKISVDPKLISFNLGNWFEKKCQELNLVFEPKMENLIDLVWSNNGEAPSFEDSIVYELPLKYTGIHANDKIAKIRSILKENKCHSLVVTALDDIAWLLNLRANDIPYNPVFFSYVILTINDVFCYINDKKIDSEASNYLSQIDGLSLAPYEKFWEELPAKLLLSSSLTPSEKKKIMLPKNATYALFSNIPTVSNEIINKDLISELKAIKNEAEIEGARRAQFKDGIALARFFAWLEYQLIFKGETIDEWTAAEKNEYYRSVLPNFKGLSFDTISSSGKNAAIIHYSPTKDNFDIINPREIYLCDSGGHYLDGTTDITRTLHFGKPTKEQVTNYTLVLKGHLGLCMEIFPEGTNSAAMDILARTPLWKQGLNYNHGTGHGIGSFLCVHEGPIYIGRNIELKKNHFISDEPGFYKDGEYGIRLESDILCCEDKSKQKFNEKAFLKFDYLTKVPFCRKLIDKKLLSDEEINWLNAYNAQLREDLIPFLEQEFNDIRAVRWLLRETQPL
ncbi:hypothetical protein PACTADRAFT_50134 [Pachysolen tannophilus NRRL Y-2460]|uniref:Xaa-Pro aminopeptidase P n=1 Tax=Pachysolen tannophilus NRRL Y-2460 TaxID=669874 RepID=A0A1E4TUI2_PACTA|nr:hypothetical protein PACTADRAFT_50134 [Pachysolen tannophilus NRRL Y-2460]